MKHPLQIVFLALVLAALGQAGWQHARLPERVALHFNAAGRANAWGPRSAETALHVGTVLFMAALIEIIVFVQARLPANLLNLPNRAHWLAPEHASATRTWLVGAALTVGCALLVFFLALFHLVYRANLGAAPRLGPSIWWLTGGLVGVILLVPACLLVRFGRKPAA